MSKVTAKNYMLSMEKDPKDPRDGNYLDLCYKDFRNFKEKNGKDIIEFLSKLIKEQEGRSNRPDLIQDQKINLENALKLLKEGNYIKEFSNFQRTVPYHKDQEARGIKHTVLIRQRENLKNVRNLINEGKERTAFSLFHRTFPYCMPYRKI